MIQITKKEIEEAEAEAEWNAYIDDFTINHPEQLVKKLSPEKIVLGKKISEFNTEIFRKHGIVSALMDETSQNWFLPKMDKSIVQPMLHNLGLMLGHEKIGETRIISRDDLLEYKYILIDGKINSSMEVVNSSMEVEIVYPSVRTNSSSGIQNPITKEKFIKVFPSLVKLVKTEGALS